MSCELRYCVLLVLVLGSTTVGCRRNDPDASRIRSSTSAEASKETADAGDRVEAVLQRVVPQSFEAGDGGFVVGPITTAQEAELRRAFNILDASTEPEPRTPTDVLRRRVASAKNPASKARARVELANNLVEDGHQSEALDLYRAVAVLDWTQISDGGINPVLPARLLLQRRGLWVGSLANGSLAAGGGAASSGGHD